MINSVRGPLASSQMPWVWGSPRGQWITAAVVTSANSLHTAGERRVVDGAQEHRGQKEVVSPCVSPVYPL